MQYYQNPVNYSLDELKSNFQVFISNVDEICELRILGGEPFMNGEMYEFLKFVSGNDKVKEIVIFTNATIPCDEKKMGELDSERCYFYISDYGIEKQRIQEYIQMFEKNHYQYHVEKFTGTPWICHDVFEQIDIDYKEAKLLYRKCGGRMCPVIIKNKLYPCEYLANAENLCAIAKNTINSVVLDPTENLRERIRNIIFSDEVRPGCFSCSRWLDAEEGKKYVEPAIQITDAIEYKVMEE